MSNCEILIREAKTLPEGIIDEVLDFIGYLKTKAAKTASREEQIGIDGECPLDHTPNATTLAAFAEGDAMMRGEIPYKKYHSAKEFLEDLEI